MTAPCLVCGALRSVETSFSKYGAPEQARPLPAAASRLIIVPSLAAEYSEKSQIRRCPSCSALFAYSQSYEYHVNGSEDEEILTRLSAADTSSWLRREAIRLDELRREIERVENEAGSLADFIDRGHPGLVDEQEALDRMTGLRKAAAADRLRLKAQVESYREICPEIIRLWSRAHIRVCRSYLDAGFPPGLDSSIARFCAQEAVNSWRALSEGGETFVSADLARFPDYEARFEVELNR